jgi:hypothetical protein
MVFEIQKLFSQFIFFHPFISMVRPYAMLHKKHRHTSGFRTFPPSALGTWLGFDQRYSTPSASVSQ